MKDYTIEGSVALKRAFVEECKLKVYDSTTITNTEFKYLTSDDMPKGEVQGKKTKEAVHFKLPEQWDEAVEYVKKFNSPKEPKVKTFKEGDYVTCIKVGSDRSAGWEQGLVFKVTSARDNIAFGGKDGNGVYFTSLRKATKAEIEAFTTITMDGYSSYIDKEKTVNFGCKSFTADDVKCIIRTIELCEYIGRDSIASIEGFKVNADTIGLDKLNIILKQLQ